MKRKLDHWEGIKFNFHLPFVITISPTQHPISTTWFILTSYLRPVSTNFFRFPILHVELPRRHRSELPFEVPTCPTNAKKFHSLCLDRNLKNRRPFLRLTKADSLSAALSAHEPERNFVGRDFQSAASVVAASPVKRAICAGLAGNVTVVIVITIVAAIAVAVVVVVVISTVVTTADLSQSTTLANTTLATHKLRRYLVGRDLQRAPPVVTTSPIERAICAILALKRRDVAVVRAVVDDDAVEDRARSLVLGQAALAGDIARGDFVGRDLEGTPLVRAAGAVEGSVGARLAGDGVLGRRSCMGVLG